MNEYKTKDKEIKELIDIVQKSDIKFVQKVRMIGLLYKLRKKITPRNSNISTIIKEESDWMNSL